MAQKMKSHALTRLGEHDERRIFYRRDAGCPVVVHASTMKTEVRTAVNGWLVNISEDGCLVASDYFPPKVKDIYVIFPGFGQKVFGVARGQGDHTLHIHFPTRLTRELADKVSRIKVVERDE